MEPSITQPETKQEQKSTPTPTVPSAETKAAEQSEQKRSNDRQRKFSSKRSLSAPSLNADTSSFENVSSPTTVTGSQSSRKAARVDMSSISDDESGSRQESITKLKATVRKRRKSLLQHPDHTVTTTTDSQAFAPLEGSKFEEALAITLRRDQEAGKKKYLKKKYRGVRSDSQAIKKRRRQDNKKLKRLA